MQNKNYFSLSWPLIRECFKMYWYIPALSFVMYFFAGIFPVLSNMKHIPELENYITESFNNLKLIYMALLIIVPVVSASIMMGYLHRESKALMLHALPMSKNRLFNSYYLSGWILCLIPVALIALLYCAIAPSTEIIQLRDISIWFISSLSMITFFYGIAVLAGSLTGTVYMNLIAVGIMMVIAPLITFIIKTYGEIFIAGFYTLPEGVLDFSVKTNPVFALIFYFQPLTLKAYGIYFIAGLALGAVSKEIYRTRKLELVGNSMLSRVFEEICTYLTVFVGMSAFGLLAWNFTRQRAFIIVGMILGILFTFAVTKIVVNRSVRIFNRGLLRSLAIYMCIAAVFISITVFDIFGIGNRVPEADQVESVEMSGLVEGYDVANLAYGDAGQEYVNNKPLLTSPEAIELTRKLHQYIIDNGIYIVDEETSQESQYEPPLTDKKGNEIYVYNEYININYHLKNGKELSRRYNIVLNDEAIEIINDLLSCEEYVEKSKITSYINVDKISYMIITPVDSYWYDYENGEGGADVSEDDMSTVIIDDKDRIIEILKAWEKDVTEGSYKNGNRSLTESRGIGSIDICFEKAKKKLDKGTKEDKASHPSNVAGEIGGINESMIYEGVNDNPYIGFMFTDIDQNLMSYLQSLGITDSMGF